MDHNLGNGGIDDSVMSDGEMRYRALAEAAQDMIFVIDRNDRIRYVNAFAAHHIGATPEQLIGKPRSDLFPADTLERQGRALRQVFESGQPLANEDKMEPLNGPELWLSNQLVPLRDAAGKVTAVMGISRDITKRIKGEKERESYVQELKQMNKLMIDRELKMVEMKKEIEQLQKETKELKERSP